MMPDLPQSAAPGQTKELSTEREISSIPKTGTGNKWEYPSPQQFFHALRRRNKEAEEDAMDDVVFVHNRVNEDSWQLVMDYEKMHAFCAEPSLQRFVGKSEDPSVKSRLRKALGLSRGEQLFDRHDWYVDRCGTKVTRYIIDSLEDVWDRVRKPWFDFWWHNGGQ